jgi:outer membrane lipoprotein-sorting protein
MFPRLQSAPLFVLLLLLTPATQAQAPDVDTIISRMEAARAENEERLRAYSVRRSYRLFPQEEPQKGGEVVARINYLPPDKKDFAIESSTGGVTERVVNRLLERESKVTRDNRSEISRENYEFTYSHSATVDGRLSHVINMEPRRVEKDMIRGQLWVDAETYLIRRIEGKLVKNPSWMVQSLNVVLDFGPVEGMWLQKQTRAIADVRFRGKYEMLSRDLAYQTSASMAKAVPKVARPTKSIRRAPAAILLR